MTNLVGSTTRNDHLEPESVSSIQATDMQVGGDHYKGMRIQPVEFIERNGLGFCEGNVIKYVSRHSNKNGLQDLQKAKHYIDLLIQLHYPSEESN